MRKTIWVLTLVLATGASAQQTGVPSLPRDEKIDQVAGDVRAIGRIATLSKDINDTRQVMQAMVDNDLDMLRDKRPDDTYRWASLQREEAGRVKDEKSVDRVNTEKELREITVSAANAYRVDVSLPTKRNLVSGNNRVWVRNVIADITAPDGKTTHTEIPVNQWVNPGDSTSVPLPSIGKNVKVTVETGIESATKPAVADVALLQAKLVDDPASPYFPAVSRLLQIRDLVQAKKIDRNLLKSTSDEALLAMPGELDRRNAEVAAAAERRRQSQATGAVAQGDATPDVIAALQEVSRLMVGTLQDQTDARMKLQALVDKLAPPPPPAPK